MMTALYEIFATVVLFSGFSYAARRFAKAELAKLHDKLDEATKKKERSQSFTRG